MLATGARKFGHQTLQIASPTFNNCFAVIHTSRHIPLYHFASPTFVGWCAKTYSKKALQTGTRAVEMQQQIIEEVSACVHFCLYLSTCINITLYKPVYLCIYIYMIIYVYIYTYTCRYMCICIYVCIYMCICIYVCIYVYMYICVYIDKKTSYIE